MKRRMTPLELAITLALSVSALVGVALLLSGTRLPGQFAPPPTIPVIATLEPQIRANLTQIPNATPLSGEAANSLNDLRLMVEACEDYVPERRAQMLQHINWLLSPADIPDDILLALGAQPDARLIFGMGTYTSAQWRILDRPADSCLIPIGESVNALLALSGQATIDYGQG